MVKTIEEEMGYRLFRKHTNAKSKGAEFRSKYTLEEATALAKEGTDIPEAKECELRAFLDKVWIHERKHSSSCIYISTALDGHDMKMEFFACLEQFIVLHFNAGEDFRLFVDKSKDLVMMTPSRKGIIYMLTGPGLLAYRAMCLLPKFPDDKHSQTRYVFETIIFNPNLYMKGSELVLKQKEKPREVQQPVDTVKV